jgi:DNA-binding response OmpR family regulator
VAEARRTVVIVDDDRAVRAGLARALTHAGYRALEAPSGLRLLSLLQVDHPDVILLDVTMSWIDGLELCRALKANRLYRSIPVIFISGRTTPDDIAAGLAAGADAYFPKPIDTAALLERIAAVLAAPPSIDGVGPVR